MARRRCGAGDGGFQASGGGATAIVVFAVAVAARNAKRPAVGIDNDDGVHAVELARPANVLD